jgi:hypothetical protein
MGDYRLPIGYVNRTNNISMINIATVQALKTLINSVLFVPELTGWTGY